MHIRTYLFMMAAGILIPVILFSGLALSMLRQSEKDAALDALNQTANSLAQRVDRELYSAEAALKVLAASPALARQDYRAFYKEAAVTNRGDNGWHVLLDEHGRQLINTSVAYGSQLPETYSLAEVRALAAKGATSVSDVTRGPMTGKRVTRVVLPIVTAGERKLLLTQTFSTDHFVQLVQNIRMPSGWLVAIIDGQGRFVARNLNAGKLVGTPARPELVAAMGISRSGRIRHSTIENTEVYDVFTHSSLCGWAFAVAAPVELIDYAARRASLVAAAGLLAATFGAIGLAAFFGGLHMRSMSAAVKAAIELGNGIPPGRVHSQVLEVNELHAALHAAGEQLVQAQAYRKHAETERECLLESEQRARLMAEQQNSAKDQFLAMLGHELRNPLAPISTAAQLLKLQSTDPNRVRYASDVITRQVDHMNSLLGDMLDVSRVTRGLVSLSLAQVNLKAIIERALEQTAGMIDVKQHALSVSFPDGELLVKGDQTRLIQIFANLINNAAKYTAPGGHIEVAASIFAGTVEVSVRDNGEGFSPDLAVRIFDLFSQGERQPDRSQGGLGLGLALVKSLVKLHGGTVEANSAGAGCGSEFVVTLPRAAGHQPSPAAARSDKGDTCARRIMIVDDNIDGALSLSMFLEDAGGHRISTYYDGGTALERAAADRPDVFILDIGLPDMTGYELARCLRAMPQCSGARYIALTGYGQPQDKERARQAGFDHHVSKPADPQYILGLLGELAQQA